MIGLVFQYWVPSQPNASTQHSNTDEMIRYSDYSCIPILISVSAYPLCRYQKSDWPLWWFWCFNIQFQVSQMHPLSIQILIGWSATLIVPAFQYWFLYQPNLCIHCLDIEGVIGHNDYSCISILSAESAKWRHSAIKYWLDDQLIWLFLQSNVDFCVSYYDCFCIPILASVSV